MALPSSAAGTRPPVRSRPGPCRSRRARCLGPWSPAAGSAVQRVQAPPRLRARTCACARLPRAQPRPIRSKRRGAANTRVVRQPAPAAAAPVGEGRSSEKEAAPRAAAARPGRNPASAAAAAPSSIAWRRVTRATVIDNTTLGRKVLCAVHHVPAGTAVAAHRCARLRAGGAVAAQHDVVPSDVVPQARGDAVDQPLELWIGERIDLAAALADRVVMVLSARVGGLEAGTAVDVEPVAPAAATSAPRARGRRSRAPGCGRSPRAAGRGSPARSGSSAGARAAQAPARARRPRDDPSGPARCARARPSSSARRPPSDGS